MIPANTHLEYNKLTEQMYVCICNTSIYIAAQTTSRFKAVLQSLFVCLFVCLLLNGTSALFRPLMPRIVEIEHTNHVKNDLK